MNMENDNTNAHIMMRLEVSFFFLYLTGTFDASEV
jgi:hypothetical protein